MKLVLFRPFILLSTPDVENGVDTSLHHSVQNPAEQDLIQQYCRSCLQVAYQLSQITYDYLGDLYCSTGWHNTHCEQHLTNNMFRTLIGISRVWLFASVALGLQITVFTLYGRRQRV